MPCHHPSAAILFGYASGSLSECLSLAVATHLTLCRDCTRSVASLEATAGALLVASEPMELSPNALEAALAALDRPAPIRVLPVVNPELPAPLSRVPAGRWLLVPWGMWVRRFRTGGAGICLLVKGRPGAFLPKHRHPGQELTVTLTGGYQDAQGIIRPALTGDFAETPDGHEYAPPRVIGTGRGLFVVASPPPQGPSSPPPPLRGLPIAPSPY